MGSTVAMKLGARVETMGEFGSSKVTVVGKPFDENYLYFIERHVRSNTDLLMVWVADAPTEAMRGRYQRLINIADAAIVQTETCKVYVDELYGCDAIIIPEASEYDPEVPHVPKKRQLGWFGGLTNFDTFSQLNHLGPIDLIVCANSPPTNLPANVSGQFAKWSPWTQLQLMKDVDAIIVPSFPTAVEKQVKGTSRVHEPQIVGCHVIASPLPEYLPYGDFAPSLKHQIGDMLSIDPNLMWERQERAWAKHSPSAVAGVWMNEIEKLASANNVDI